MKAERIIYILIVIVLVGIMIFQHNKLITPQPEKLITRIDTLYITDSLIIEKPIYKERYITHTVVDTLYTTDSIYVPVHIPMQTAIYQDSTPTYRYKATISGYKPSLDELQVFTTTPQYNTTTIKYKPKKWSLSVGASYNIKGQLYPSLNIGYNIFSW